MGFTSPSMGDGSTTGPKVLCMENSDIAAVVVVDVSIYKRADLEETPDTN